MRSMLANVADLGSQTGMHASALRLTVVLLLILAVMSAYFGAVNEIGHVLPGKAIQDTGGSIDHFLRRMNGD